MEFFSKEEIANFVLPLYAVDLQRMGQSINGVGSVTVLQFPYVLGEFSPVSVCFVAER